MPRYVKTNVCKKILKEITHIGIRKRENLNCASYFELESLL